MSQNELQRVVEMALRSYGLQFTLDEDGCHLPLVDALTPAGDANIGRGKQEIELLAEHIAIEAAQAVAPGGAVEAFVHDVHCPQFNRPCSCKRA